MTRDEINALTGRELDVAIARQVFKLQVLGEAICMRDPEHGGWSVNTMKWGPSKSPDGMLHMQPVYLERCGCDEIKKDNEDRGMSDWAKENEHWPLGHHWSCLEVVPHYSTNLQFAFLVVDHLSKLGHSLILQDCRSLDIQECHRCWWARFDLADGHDTGDWLGETAMMAICRAALKAVREAKVLAMLEEE